MYRWLTDMSKRPITKLRLSAIRYKSHHIWLKVVDIIKRRLLAVESIYMIQRLIDA